MTFKIYFITKNIFKLSSFKLIKFKLKNFWTKSGTFKINKPNWTNFKSAIFFAIQIVSPPLRDLSM